MAMHRCTIRLLRSGNWQYMYRKYIKYKEDVTIKQYKHDNPLKCLFATTSGHAKSIQGDRERWPKPPVDFKTEVPLWPGQARSG